MEVVLRAPGTAVPLEQLKVALATPGNVAAFLRDAEKTGVADLYYLLHPSATAVADVEFADVVASGGIVAAAIRTPPPETTYGKLIGLAVQHDSDQRPLAAADTFPSPRVVADTP